MDDQNAQKSYLMVGQHILADMPLSMVLTDPNRPDNPIVYVNRAFEATTGYSATHAVGQNCRFLQGDLPRQDEVKELASAVRDRRETVVVLRNKRPDGSEFLNRLMIAPVRDENGDLYAFVGIQTVVEPNDPPRAAVETFEDTMREMQHRVKNHLQMVASMIRLQSASDEPPEAAFAMLSRRVESLASLYDEFSAPPARVRGGRYDVVSAGGYVGRVVATVGALDGRRNIRTTIEVDPVYMRTEQAAQLGLLVSEILSNALQHAFSGRSEGLVEVRLRQGGGDRVRLTVSDDGTGLGTSGWPREGGTGARIACGLARQLGGELNVTSSRGGTVVTLDFENELQSGLDEAGDRVVTEDRPAAIEGDRD